MAYQPRDLTDAQKNFRVDLHTDFGGAYGYGETLDEAEKNAMHFFRRDFGRKKPRARIVQQWTVDHWEEIPNARLASWSQSYGAKPHTP